MNRIIQTKRHTQLEAVTVRFPLVRDPKLVDLHI